MLNSNFEGEVTVFAKTWNEKKFYSTSIAKKKQDGTYDNGYINLVFKKGVEIENKQKINIKKAFLTFYLKEEKPVWQIFVLDYEDEATKSALDSFKKSDVPEGFNIAEDDIPF